MEPPPLPQPLLPPRSAACTRSRMGEARCVKASVPLPAARFGRGRPWPWPLPPAAPRSACEPSRICAPLAATTPRAAAPVACVLAVVAVAVVAGGEDDGEGEREPRSSDRAGVAVPAAAPEPGAAAAADNSPSPSPEPSKLARRPARQTPTPLAAAAAAEAASDPFARVDCSSAAESISLTARADLEPSPAWLPPCSDACAPAASATEMRRPSCAAAIASMPSSPLLLSAAASAGNMLKPA